MKIRTVLVVSITCVVLTALQAMAQDHQMGHGAMKHIDLWLDGSAVQFHIDDSVPTPQLSNPLPPGHHYEDAKAVLNGTAHNNQYGWQAAGLNHPPSGAGYFIRLLDQTPGLRAYTPDMTPIFGTDGASDTWLFPGIMTHNWYAMPFELITEPDMPVFATYEVYVGSTQGGEFGTPLLDYQPATVTLHFTAIPEPTIGMALPAIALALSRRPRRNGPPKQTLHI
mgnify:CR=1 FL=1